MQQREGRRGKVFPLRLTDEERLRLEGMRARSAGPTALGPWLVWAARAASSNGVLPARSPRPVLPELGTRSPGSYGITGAGDAPGITRSSPTRRQFEPKSRIILDLCAGSGAWSKPYVEAGYAVYCVTLPELDVRVWEPPRCEIWGILAAPPCTEFSMAKNGRERDIRKGLEVVSACTRIILATKPKWWAIENPTGMLSKYLGTARDVWEPYEFGDPWTKRTAVWGDFAIPERGPFVKPLGSAMDRKTPALRAVTPPGFARAFFEANP